MKKAKRNRGPQRRRMIHLYITATMILTLLIPTAMPARADHLFPDQDYEAVETLVLTGQYHLNFKVIKGSDLVILLESGGGMDSNEWTKLAPKLAEQTGATIVSYDRAGFGKSDLPDNKHDMKEETGWLWQGLQKLELNTNLILVGHSFGGWMIRLFASEHPEVVRGLVFVDPFTNELVDLMGIAIKSRASSSQSRL